MLGGSQWPTSGRWCKVEARDTVIEELDEYRNNNRWIDLANAQAEATWPIAEKAGMLKVVEWIDKEIPMTLQNLRRWQTFLKEQVFK